MGQRIQKLLWVAALLSALLSAASGADARRSRYRPQPVSAEEEEDGQRYYQQPAAAAATQVETEQAGVVLVSSDPYNGLYGRQTDTAAAAPRYRGSAASRAAVAAAAAGAPRTKEPKQPPVQTIRNYSKVNDDGSFTFGYESADGSFKEETRGTDCVVRGKYGYIDPDGNKREFTYVSGNPCDPNNPEGRDPQQAEEEDDSGEENIPKVPIRPLRPLRPTVATPQRPQTTTTVFQNDYRQEQLGQPAEDEVDDEPQQLYTARPAYSIPSTSSLYHQYDTQQYTTSAPVVYRTQPQQAVSITPRPRPAVAPSTVRSQLPATTYRPQLLATATPRPQTTSTQLYTRPPAPPAYQPSTPSPFSTAARSQAQLYGRTTSLYQPSSTVATADVDFDEELRKFQLENNVVTTPRTVSPAALAQRVQPVQHAQLSTARPQPVVQQARKVPPAPAASSDPIYSSELVYDPATGQYNTVLYQTLPQTQGELNLRASIQPYVAQQQPQLQGQQLQQQQQQYYQQLLQAQQLYAQQRQRSRYEVTTPPPARQQQYRQAQAQQAPQTYYYVAAPAGPAAAAPTGREAISHGQIEAFLRGHNIAF